LLVPDFNFTPAPSLMLREKRLTQRVEKSERQELASSMELGRQIKGSISRFVKLLILEKKGHKNEIFKRQWSFMTLDRVGG